MKILSIDGREIHVDTDSFTSTIATEGYTVGDPVASAGFIGGVKGGSLGDRKTDIINSMEMPSR